MLSTRMQFVIVAAMALCVLRAVWLLSRGKLDYKLGIGWIGVFCAIAVLGLAPGLLDRAARVFGIAAPVNMLFFFGFLFCAVILFALSRRTANLQAQVRRLAQELAILRKEAPGTSAGADETADRTSET